MFLVLLGSTVSLLKRFRLRCLDDGVVAAWRAVVKSRGGRLLDLAEEFVTAMQDVIVFEALLGFFDGDPMELDMGWE